MPRVFVVNEPLKKDEAGHFGRRIDVTPARQYGELCFLSPAGEPPTDHNAWLEQMREVAEQYEEGDFLLPVGHPLLIVAAAAIIAARAASQAGLVLRVLRWNGPQRRYVAETLQIFPGVRGNQ